MLNQYAILYATLLILTSKHQALTFSKNQPSSLGCFFERYSPFFTLAILSLFSAEPLYQDVRIDHKITFTFSEN